jgi:hypothetical protein
MRILTILCLVIITSCPEQNSSRAENEKIQGFDSYLNFFEEKSLPIVLDRRAVFDLSKEYYDTLDHSLKNDLYKEINSTFNIFLPKEIIDTNQNESYRALFALTKFNNFKPVLIAKDIFVEEEQRQLEIWLITYNSDGRIIDYFEIAGYALDANEKFTKINQDNSIEVLSYEFKKAPDNKVLDQFYLKEIKTILKISENGEILKTAESTREGYFIGVWHGYSYSNEKK